MQEILRQAISFPLSLVPTVAKYNPRAHISLGMNNREVAGRQRKLVDLDVHIVTRLLRIKRPTMCPVLLSIDRILALKYVGFVLFLLFVTLVPSLFSSPFRFFTFSKINWDHMERFWEQAIFKYLRCEPEDHYFLLVRL